MGAAAPLLPGSGLGGGLHRLRREDQGSLSTFCSRVEGARWALWVHVRRQTSPWVPVPAWVIAQGPRHPVPPPLAELEQSWQDSSTGTTLPASVALGSSLNTALPKWGGSEPPEGAGAALQCILKGAEPVMPPPRGAGHPVPNGLLSTVGTEAPPPEAGSAPGHGLPQPLVLRRIISASHVGGDISAGRAALPGDCAGSWPPPPGGGRGGKLALEAPGERKAASLQEGSCGEAGPGCVPKFRGDCRLTSCASFLCF